MMKTEKPAVKKKNGGARPGAGRKAFEPTLEERRQVEAMSGYGVPQKEIAAVIRDGINVETLVKYFESEIVKGRSKANAKIGQTLFQKAVSGDTTAAIFWAKTRMGWKDTTRLEHSGSIDSSVEVSVYLPDNGREMN